MITEEIQASGYRPWERGILNDYRDFLHPAEALS